MDVEEGVWNWKSVMDRSADECVCLSVQNSLWMGMARLFIYLFL